MYRYLRYLMSMSTSTYPKWFRKDTELIHTHKSAHVHCKMTGNNNDYVLVFISVDKLSITKYRVL